MGRGGHRSAERGVQCPRLMLGPGLGQVDRAQGARPMPRAESECGAAPGEGCQGSSREHPKEVKQVQERGAAGACLGRAGCSGCSSQGLTRAKERQAISVFAPMRYSVPVKQKTQRTQSKLLHTLASTFLLSLVSTISLFGIPDSPTKKVYISLLSRHRPEPYALPNRPVHWLSACRILPA